MEDENNDALMTEFVGLRTKMYTIRVHGIQECVNKRKGIKRNVVAKNIDLEHYIECLGENMKKSISRVFLDTA
jgi:hypothetical protein